ncbi:MAG TPA: EamA family transporter [Bryobacteraceae bacterium]|nr:EamA family transporter [Bryobacteraceae bacterium]
MRSHSHFKAYVALAAVCIFWGTTYLGIRMALESLTPPMLVCLRYTLSGSLMMAGAFFVKAHLPRGRELWYTALFGVITIGIGNGCLAVAEMWVPSGMAALFVITSPFWMVGVEALIPGGDRLHGPTIAGMFIGLAGTLLLIAPGAIQQGWNGPMLKGFLVLQLGSCGWAFGSILQRRYTTRAHPAVSGAVQQLATGLIYIAPALLFQSGPIHWTWRGVAAILYLMTFGSIIGYSAFIYAMEKLPVSVVSIYNYINPIVAVILGWLFYREHVGWRELFAMLIVFAGVAVVKRYGRAVTAKPRTPGEPIPASLDAVEPRTGV